MRPALRRSISLALLLFFLPSLTTAQEKAPFGPDFPNLDSDATGEWWKPKGKKDPRLLVPRDKVIGFAVYTHQNGTLKLTAQLYPLKPDESRAVVLEFQRDGQWKEAAREKVIELGWSAHFRIEDWDNSQTVPYRLSHAGGATFEGTIRKDPSDKDVIVVASLSCNSSRTPGPRPTMVKNLLAQDPDLVFCAGDQSYHHTQHTFGWLEFGEQFRDVLKDRPVITIPDDHDVGQANIWGENGKVASTPAGPDGGYYYPVDYVNMVQRCQTWHLPDPYDPTPIERGITVYYTSLNVGGVDFAILEDRKFKSGPEGKIPKMGPRPDHINDPNYDRKSVDVPGLKLLGDRQLKFLHAWSEDWTKAEMKCALSQTAFCGAVHIHGQPDNRLLADLDCNGWPQTGRNKALTEIRRAWAPHLCGDQHLAVVVKHGIDHAGDGPYAFTSPAIVNTIYGRWWHPEDEQPGPNAVAGSPLPWTGDYLDGLGNHIRMLAYANPEDRTDETQRADGYGIARFHKQDRTVTFECWPRFADLSQGDDAQFPGWPITVKMEDNDGREPVGFLPEIHVKSIDSPVVQVMNEESGEVLYTVRFQTNRLKLPVYSQGKHTVRIGQDTPDGKTLSGLTAELSNHAEVGLEKPE
ncbi:MAG: metallophosphoesterase [Planctomycetaceae bacterium]|nr:metallophosphoesterase [Planctomycetaceae bacterium]